MAAFPHWPENMAAFSHCTRKHGCLPFLLVPICPLVLCWTYTLDTLCKLPTTNLCLPPRILLFQGLDKLLRVALNSHCSPGKPWTCDCPYPGFPSRYYKPACVTKFSPLICNVSFFICLPLTGKLIQGGNHEITKQSIGNRSVGKASRVLFWRKIQAWAKWTNTYLVPTRYLFCQPPKGIYMMYTYIMECIYNPRNWIEGMSNTLKGISYIHCINNGAFPCVKAVAFVVSTDGGMDDTLRPIWHHQ